MIEADKIALKMRKGEIDCNNQELFFSILIKGLLTKLNKDIYIRQQSVPHVIINTGDVNHFVSIPFDAIDDFIEWLTDVRTLIKTKTHYFDEPVKMTRAEIEKALGHKFIICD